MASSFTSLVWYGGMVVWLSMVEKHSVLNQITFGPFNFSPKISSKTADDMTNKPFGGKQPYQFSLPSALFEESSKEPQEELMRT